MENGLKQLLNALKTDSRTAELVRGMEKPRNDEEAVNGYARLAEALGQNLTRDEIAEGLARLSREQQERTAQAELDSEKALDSDSAQDGFAGWEKSLISENALDIVAGGDKYRTPHGSPEAVAAGEKDPRCAETFIPGEFCWYTDTCQDFINFY